MNNFKRISERITFNIDFDGTCVTHEFPRIGKDIGAQKVLKRLIEHGHQLILFTMRSDRKVKRDPVDKNIKDVTGNFLSDAVKWFKDNDIELYGIQSNPTQMFWTTSPKSYAELMIDDSALGIPLLYNDKISDRPYVNWAIVEAMLEGMGLFDEKLKRNHEQRKK